MGYTNLGANNPTPGDPAVKNSWGTIENEGRTIFDAAISAVTSINVAGASNVVVTTTPGSTAQDPATHFVLTGALTGNIDVLWPNGKTRKFTVYNDTTGAYALSIGADNGSGSAAGAVVPVPQGTTIEVFSDGTDVVLTGTVSSNQGAGINWAVAGGTADAITGTFHPPNGNLTDGLILAVRAAYANATTTPTFAPDGLSAEVITNYGGVALKPGDIPGEYAEITLRYNLAETRWELQNPAVTEPPWAVAGGTADAITGTYAPPNAALYDGLLLAFRAGAANATTTPTFNADSLGATTITKEGGAVLLAGDIPGALAECLVRYNAANTRWELLNPAGAPSVPHGQCRLTYVSTTSIKLAPLNGNSVQINGVAYAIPSAGVAAANTSVYVNGVSGQNLAASTVYYVALWNNSGTLTLGYWVYGTYTHTPDTTAGNVGVEIIETVAGSVLHSGQSLVGMIYTDSGSHFVQADPVIGVLSWFNQRPLAIITGLFTTSTASTSPTPLMSTRYALCWANGVLHVSITNLIENGGSATDTAVTFLNVDGGDVALTENSLANTFAGNASLTFDNEVTEGLHTAYFGGSTSDGNTFDWFDSNFGFVVQG